MKVSIELPAPVAAALLRYCSDKGFATMAGAIGHLVIVYLAQGGYF